jgi:hypothetical protein
MVIEKRLAHAMEDCPAEVRDLVDQSTKLVELQVAERLQGLEGAYAGLAP